jgi:transcriptional regulator with XRE-family HTH domain
MAREGLTGSRIRERRVMAGLKQADLARDIGISASYLNLIEHNRRRIGGKLLLNIASVLGVEPQTLTEGAEAALIAALREAADEAGLTGPEASRADEFAGRFPGWADVLAGTRRRVASLEQTVEALTDRLAHDPHLAASMHELLTTAAAIRSTACLTVRRPWYRILMPKPVPPMRPAPPKKRLRRSCQSTTLVLAVSKPDQRPKPPSPRL